MKCKICGHRTSELSAMRKHYTREHPSALKHKKDVTRVQAPRTIIRRDSARFCPYCGQQIS